MLGYLKRLIKPLIKSAGSQMITAGGKIITSLSGKEWHEFPRDFLYTQIHPKLLDDPKFLDCLNTINKSCAFGKDGPLPTYRLYLLWQMVRTCQSIKGDIVEFGSYRGGTAYILLSATNHWTPTNHVFLYDTFAGLPHYGLTEKEKTSQFHGRFHNTSVEIVEELLEPFSERIHLKPGIIPESLQQSSPKEISFMHFDLNAAQPTLDALEWAFPRWTSNGICLFDDYLDKEYQEQRTLVEKFFRSKSREIVGFPTGQGIVINR